MTTSPRTNIAVTLTRPAGTAHQSVARQVTCFGQLAQSAAFSPLPKVCKLTPCTCMRADTPISNVFCRAAALGRRRVKTCQTAAAATWQA